MMRHSPMARIFLVWIILVSVTLIGFVVTSAHEGEAGFFLVVILAGLKARLITTFFMDLHDTSAIWQRIFDGLVLAAVSIIAALHLAALSGS